MSQLRYYNQTGPFWDFIASMEEQGRSHPLFGGNNDNADNEHENANPWGNGWGLPFGGPFAHRGRHHGQGPPPQGPPPHGARPHGPPPHGPPPHGPPHHGGPPPPPPPPGGDHEMSGPPFDEERNVEDAAGPFEHHGPPHHRPGHGPGHGRGHGPGHRHSHGGPGHRRGGGPGPRGGYHGGPPGHRGGPEPHAEMEHDSDEGEASDPPSVTPPSDDEQSPPHHPPHHPRHHGHGHGHGPGHRGGPGSRGRHGGRGGWGGRPRGPPGFNNPMAFIEMLQSQLFGDAAAARAPGAVSDDFQPEVDIFDTPSSFVVHASLPGAKKDDVGVHWDAEKSELCISGVIHRPGDEELLKTLALDERRVGAFERKVRLGSRASPALVDAEGIAARMEEGVLRVEVPKLDAGFVEIKKVDIE